MSADLEFEKLVKLYYRDLYRFGFSLTGSEADAADLTQETFYIWANKGDQLNNPRSVKGWLFTTLHREFLKICRRRKRFADEPIEESMHDLPDVPVDCVNRIDSRTLVRMLAEIDEDFRAPLGTLLHGGFLLQTDCRRAGGSDRDCAVANCARENAAFASTERDESAAT